MRRVAARALLAFVVFAFASGNSADAAAQSAAVSVDAAAEPDAAPAPAPAPPVPPAAASSVAAASTPAEPAAVAAPPAAPAAVPPAKPVRPLGDLQSPEQLNTRYSAYALPAGQWTIKTGALGIGDGDLFAQLAVGYGLGRGVQLNANLMHMGVGLINISAGWHFIDTRYFDLGARLGIWYGHGKWFWIADTVATKIVSKLDAIKVPIELTASSTPTRWLELDLGVQFTYAKLFGTASSDERSLFTDSELGTQQFFLRPGVRLFISDNTAFEFFAKVPIYSAVNSDSGSAKVPFDRVWSVEGGLRSRLARGFFGNLRLQYAAISDVLYGARLYPSFDLEFRF